MKTNGNPWNVGMVAMALICAMCSLSSVQASGMLIPKDEAIPPLAIKSQRVDIEIKDGVASARIIQIFKNSTNRDLEAIYVFPLPENAAIADFAMTINGKRMSGELVEKDKARQIYQDIVRRMKDPGLLEHLGGNLFRVSVYPVPKNGEQKIELVYSQTLEFESGLYKYVYPLRTADQASRTMEDFTVGVRLTSALPIKNVYSASHQVGITRKSDHEVRVGFEEERSLLDRDFVLYYGVSKKDFGLNLLTHAVRGEDGYFMMMIAPSLLPREGGVIQKDVTFVIDTSGSMRGPKMEQARKALEYCVRKLNEGDRFNIIRFSTDAESFKEGWVSVDETQRKAALDFIGQFDAQGGTCIHEALHLALRQKADPQRPSLIVFLTDGKPTIGETDTAIIVDALQKANAGGTRIFVFGVGDEVNTHLLDKISGQNGGLSQYVKPDEDIEVKVSSFADKISQPVLAQVKVEIDKLKIIKQHPRDLQDLFWGEQITLLGRYQGKGDYAIRLTGQVNGAAREFVYEGSFPVSNSDNDFIPRLWATRRVGTLLDEIRLHGENGELKDEVIRLSKEFGIMTPYTSYLVLESEQEYDKLGIARPKEPKAEARNQPDPQGWTGGRRGAEHKEKGDLAKSMASVPIFRGTDMLALESAAVGGKDETPEAPAATARVADADSRKVDGYMKAQSGAAAVDLSQAIADYKQRSIATEDTALVRHVENRIFYLIQGVWVDSAYTGKMKETTVKFASEEYFQLLKEKPELKKFLALGKRVVVCLGPDAAFRVEE
jgi:Ca-activated chloride channel family protein